jgi:hypothetical protein
MTIQEFTNTLSSTTPPPLSPLLLALWHDANGGWEKAHTLAQDVEGEAGAWVHAYLHRKEGDLDNAADWYRRGNHPIATDALEAEWTRIVSALL